MSMRWIRLRGETASTLALAWPIVGGQLATIAMNVIDTVLAGRLGTRVLAAVAMGYQAWVVALLAVIGIMMAVSPTVAQLDGAGRRAETGHVFRQAMWLAAALGIGFFAALRNARPLLVAAGVDAEIVPGALEFLDAIAWGAPALAFFFAMKNFSEGLSLTRPTLYFSALGAVVLLPVAYVMMYGRLGFPALGARGAGYAHALVLWLEVACFAVYIATRRHYHSAEPFTRFERPDPKAIGELLRIGLPMGFAVFMEGTLFVATALLAGRLGTVPAAAHQIAINVASVTFMLPLGIGMATTVRVGNAVGRRDPDAVAWAAAAGFGLVLMTQALAAAAMILAPVAIARAYTGDAAVVALAVSLLWLAALFQLSDGIQALFNAALRGLKDTSVPAAITAFAYWGVGFPLGYVLGIVRGGGAPGLWIGLIGGLSVAALLLAGRFVRRVRRLNADAQR
ncbi:MAG TPA: MATE family efflux transporter [Xanthomonadales bacterium]|nr:MATE family efflux transporter [Xanthomonadales bacterium]